MPLLRQTDLRVFNICAQSTTCYDQLVSRNLPAEVPMPRRHVLVGQTGGHVEHDDSTLPMNTAEGETTNFRRLKHVCREQERCVHKKPNISARDSNVLCLPSISTVLAAQ
jgi:hypothetical protein